MPCLHDLCQPASAVSCLTMESMRGGPAHVPPLATSLARLSEALFRLMRSTVGLNSLSMPFTLLGLNVDDLPSALGLKAHGDMTGQDPPNSRPYSWRQE